MDRITLAGFQVFTHVGCSAEERTVGQWLTFRIDMELDLRRAGEADALDASVDYARALQVVKDAVEGREAKLIETIAEEAAKALRAAFPLERVIVRVRKPEPPMPVGRAEYAEVRIER